MFNKINFFDNKPLKHKFNRPTDSNKYGFNLFTVAAFIGGMNSGKSTAMINLAKYFEDNKLITEIILVSPTIYSNGWNELKILDENKYDLNEINIDETLTYLMDYMKIKTQQWQDTRNNMTEEEYNAHYKKIYKIYKKYLRSNDNNQIIRFEDEDEEHKDHLNALDFEMLEDNNLESKAYYYKHGPSFLLIFDDILGSGVISNKKTNLLNKIIANHRHLRANIFLALQSYTNGIPKNIRRIIKMFIIFKYSDTSEIKNFYQEIGSSIFSSFEEFELIYREITEDSHNFILIDLDPKSSNLKIRKNFNEILNY